MRPCNVVNRPDDFIDRDDVTPLPCTRFWASSVLSWVGTRPLESRDQ